MTMISHDCDWFGCTDACYPLRIRQVETLKIALASEIGKLSAQTALNIIEAEGWTLTKKTDQ